MQENVKIPLILFLLSTISSLFSVSILAVFFDIKTPFYNFLTLILPKDVVDIILILAAVLLFGALLAAGLGIFTAIKTFRNGNKFISFAAIILNLLVFGAASYFTFYLCKGMYEALTFHYYF